MLNREVTWQDSDSPSSKDIHHLGILPSVMDKKVLQYLSQNVHGSSGNPVDIFVPDNNSKNNFVRDDNDDGVTNTNTSTKRRRQVIRKKWNLTFSKKHESK